MRPVLFNLGSVAVPTFEAFMALGFAGGAVLVWLLAPRLGIGRRRALEFALAAIGWGVLGAKLGHCLFEAPGHALPDGSTSRGIADLLVADPWHALRLLDGGYVWYGGLLLASAALTLHARWRRVAPAALADLFAPSVAWGLAVGRLGCLGAGCCYGLPSELPWALRYPTSGGLTVPLHPVPIYESLVGVGLLAFALWRLPRRRFAGELFATLLAVHAPARFALELLRGDGERGLYLGGALSTSQIISIAIFPAALYYLVRGRSRARRGVACGAAPSLPV